MSFTQLHILVSAQAADALTDTLLEHGALSAAIEDAYAGTEAEEPVFGEPGMPTHTLWQHSLVLALFDEDSDAPAALAAAAAQMGIALPQYSIHSIAEQDWVRLTQAQFDPIRISPRLWITPSWHQSPDPAAVNIELDPGLAFGTGSHPTTRLCLQWLDQHLTPGQSVLDYGCGSGILAIAALRLGAGRTVGIDIDPQAVAASIENAKKNYVEAEFMLPEKAATVGQFDVVVANILANPLRLLAPMLANFTRNGGTLVLSGLLAEQVEEISALYAQWFDMAPAVIEEQWACLYGKKRAADHAVA